MKVWMDVMRDLEHVMENHERLFSAWAEGGVDGLVMGPPVFNAADLMPGVRSREKGSEPVPTYEPNPEVYRRFGVTPPDTVPVPKGRRALLEKTFAAAKNLGWSVWIFQPQTGMGPGGDGHRCFARPDLSGGTGHDFLDSRKPGHRYLQGIQFAI